MVVTGLHGGEPDPILPLSQGAGIGQVWSMMHTLSLGVLQVGSPILPLWLMWPSQLNRAFCNIKLDSFKFDK